MKYRRKINKKYIPDTKQSNPPLRKHNLNKRSVIAASLTLTLFCASRLGYINTDAVKKAIFSKESNDIGTFVETKIPFLKKFGEIGAEFCFGYLKGNKNDSKAVFANEKTNENTDNNPEESKDSEKHKISQKKEELSHETHASPGSDTGYTQEATEVTSENIFDPIKPCDGKITSPFGKRVHPVSGQGNFHNGLDIAANAGTEVAATEDGTVRKSVYDQFSGNLIILTHTDGYTSSYAHLAKSYVSEGQSVKKGDIIGLVGSTGISTGPHLHIEIRKNGEPVDPSSFYNKG